MSQEAVHSSSSILRDSRHFGLGSNSFEGICPNGSPLTDGQRSLAKHFCQRLHFFFLLYKSDRTGMISIESSRGCAFISPNSVLPCDPLP